VPVSTATDALRLASKADVVVTGILLPDHMDGIELVRRLKSAESTKHVPVLVLTACVWQSDRDRATASGCDLFLAKPCLPDVLVREIHRVLTLHLLPTPQMATASRLVVRNVS
jgi:CheY-like chemotaxis protein